MYKIIVLIHFLFLMSIYSALGQPLSTCVKYVIVSIILLLISFKTPLKTHHVPNSLIHPALCNTLNIVTKYQ